MELLIITRTIAIVALAVCLVAIALRLNGILHRPRKRDLSRPRGSRARGIVYAFTLGMAPWEKESARKHWVAYLRGVIFHLGLFASMAAFLVSPWLPGLPLWLRAIAAIFAGAGALAGFAATVMRRLDRNERALSVPDDYFAVGLSALFVALACVALLAPAALPAFYIVAALLLLYIPFGKIRHCIYFFYAKFFYGENIGQRGVIGHTGGGAG
jgi:nitrate reductase gamma subunit